MTPYKRRRLDPDGMVFVYRNLNKSDGVWYSLLQGGLVVGHAEFVFLRDVRFVVQPGGRKRALATGVKNVHAFAAGYLVPANDDGLRLGYRAGYTPSSGFWVDGAEGRRVLTSAQAAVLSKDGLTVSNPSQ